MLLIDGYNVLFVHGVPSDIPRAREAFLWLVESYCARSGQRARVFFDRRGESMCSRLQHVDVRFTGNGQTADDAIMGLVDATNDRTGYRVVSSDRQIADAARKRKIDVTASKDFLKEIEPAAVKDADPAEKRDGISAAEAKVWMRTFGLGEGHEAR